MWGGNGSAGEGAVQQGIEGLIEEIGTEDVIQYRIDAKGKKTRTLRGRVTMERAGRIKIRTSDGKTHAIATERIVSRSRAGYLKSELPGVVAGGAHPSPVGHAEVISSTTHKTFRGPRGGMIMCTSEHKKAIDRAVFPGLQGGPHNGTTAGIAIAAQLASTDEIGSAHV